MLVPPKNKNKLKDVSRKLINARKFMNKKNELDKVETRLIQLKTDINKKKKVERNRLINHLESLKHCIKYIIGETSYYKLQLFFKKKGKEIYKRIPFTKDKKFYQWGFLEWARKYEKRKSEYHKYLQNEKKLKIYKNEEEQRQAAEAAKEKQQKQIDELIKLRESEPDPEPELNINIDELRNDVENNDNFVNLEIDEDKDKDENINLFNCSDNYENFVIICDENEIEIGNVNFNVKKKPENPKGQIFEIITNFNDDRYRINVNGIDVIYFKITDLNDNDYQSLVNDINEQYKLSKNTNNVLNILYCNIFKVNNKITVEWLQEDPSFIEYVPFNLFQGNFFDNFINIYNQTHNNTICEYNQLTQHWKYIVLICKFWTDKKYRIWLIGFFNALYNIHRNNYFFKDLKKNQIFYDPFNYYFKFSDIKKQDQDNNFGAIYPYPFKRKQKTEKYNKIDEALGFIDKELTDNNLINEVFSKTSNEEEIKVYKAAIRIMYISANIKLNEKMINYMNQQNILYPFSN